MSRRLPAALVNGRTISAHPRAFALSALIVIGGPGMLGGSLGAQTTSTGAPSRTAGAPAPELVGVWNTVGGDRRPAGIAFLPDSSFVVYVPERYQRRETFDGVRVDTIAAAVAEFGRWRIRGGASGEFTLCVRPTRVADHLRAIFQEEACAPLTGSRGSGTVGWAGATAVLLRGRQPVPALVQRLAAGASTQGDSVAIDETVSGGDQPYFEFQVEKQAVQVPGTGVLRYPDMLKSANIEGEVLAQFVVDREGRYEPGTFKVIKSSHDLFTAAVKNALPNIRFTPAEVGGRRVKQLVQQPFTFTLTK